MLRLLVNQSVTCLVWTNRCHTLFMLTLSLLLVAIQSPQEALAQDELPVLVELFEDMGVKKSKTPAAEAPPEIYKGVRALADGEQPDQVYRVAAFGFHRLPNQYDATGVRILPKGPMLFRASASLTLPAGRHRLILRTRDDARLFIDQRLAGEVKALELRTDGHNPTLPLPELIVPGIKEFAPGNVELVLEFVSDGLPHTFLLETVVGRSDRRPDLGVLALAGLADKSQEAHLLAGNPAFPFTDLGWERYVTAQETYYRQVDAQERARQSAAEAEYWHLRHDYARSWLAERKQVTPPEVGSLPVLNAVDRFIGRRIEQAAWKRLATQADIRRARSQGLVHYEADIQPLLKEHCFRCHGEQEQGLLRLDSRERLLQGGESAQPAIVVGEPESSLLIEQVTTQQMPPDGRKLNEEEIELLTRWIEQGAQWQQLDEKSLDTTRHPSPAELAAAGLMPVERVGDLEFLRRVCLDTIGVIPTPEELQVFLADKTPDKRSRAIDRLLEDPRWADHWVPFWQDVLAENPNIVKPNLNNTGAFRWWIHEAFLDNKPMDQFVTDLVRMRGDKYIGPAGFGMATQNDAPMAAKAHILAGAFLGVQMKCARCHDAPYQSVTQADLFSLAAMLSQEPVGVPSSSLVPREKLQGRESLVRVTLEPGQLIAPEWPFASLVAEPLPAALMADPQNSRETLAAHITSPANPRFAQTLVNWLWKRYFGRGLVEPTIDWEHADCSHPELLDYLAQELVGHAYDLKHVARLILNSHTYQRGLLSTRDAAAEVFPSEDLLAEELLVGQRRRRMTAEQIVDSFHVATACRIDCEELNMDQDGRRPLKQFVNLGQPQRAWEFTSLSNERDRPSLTLPHAQVYVDVLEAFGWNGARQNPIYDREHEANVLQPATMSNGIMLQRLTRLTDEHPLTQLTMAAASPAELVQNLFLRTLGRGPDPAEEALYVELLRDGFDTRIVPEDQRPAAKAPKRYPYVTWSNHLRSDANEIKDAIARDIEAGESPTRFLTSQWREHFEDGLWALLNSPEMIFIP